MGKLNIILHLFKLNLFSAGNLLDLDPS